MTECAGEESAGSLIEEIDECTDYIVSNYGQSDVWTLASPFGWSSSPSASDTAGAIAKATV